MLKLASKLLIIILVLPFPRCSEPGPADLQVDVLVLGGGTGGVAAGIASARNGAATLVVEPTAWLGGMLTSAGVSAIDGNHALPAGLWGEFRDSLYAHYGGADSVSTGWVSMTLFEPQVGARILENMAEGANRLDVWTNSNWKRISRQEGLWQVEVEHAGEMTVIRARVLIDGTDLGDVAAAAGAPYDLGMDARAHTGEPMAPIQANDIIQDLTYAAILKDYGPDADRTIEKPEGYDPSEFHCSCLTNCDGSYDLPCDMMLSYGRLPRGYYMINWPNAGNDYYANMVEMTEEERQVVFRKAKQHTLRFVYYIQHELGYRHLGLADDVFPSSDSLPLIPYHREGRRIQGLTRLTVDHITDPFAQEDPLYRTGIAVGDYPIDHHHGKNPQAPPMDFPPVPSFSVPAGSLVPAETPHLVIADKPVSVSNIVNGSTRLQPVVLQIGQAAGTMAALAVQEDRPIHDLSVREIQGRLLDEGGYLMPYYDVPPGHPHFAAIQRIGATGLLKGSGQPYQWANRTWFYPDAPLSDTAMYKGLEDFYGFPAEGRIRGRQVDMEMAVTALHEIAERENDPGEGAATPLEKIRTEVEALFSQLGMQAPSHGETISRSQWAVMLDRILDPFHRYPVDWEGNVLRKEMD